MDGQRERLLKVGSLVKAHGLKGEVLVRSESSGSQVLLEQERCFVLARGAPEAQARPVRIVSARAVHEAILLRLEGVEDRDAAHALVGSGVLLPRVALPPAEPGEYYVADLVGLSARTPDGRRLGVVARVGGLGEVPVLEIEGERDWQIPLVDVFVKRVDVPAGEVVVEPPEEEG